MEALTKISMVAVGGAFGAVARYLINISPLAGLFGKFPFPTFVINVVGSFLIGFCLYFFTDKFDIGENLRLAIIVGLLGAFTTFSTFEMEVYGLVKDRAISTALLYLILSVAVAFIGLVAGIALAKRI
ncbi:MAG: fluoride efflux transporter CrcB [Pyrinomonadaceae bacterium]